MGAISLKKKAKTEASATESAAASARNQKDRRREILAIGVLAFITFVMLPNAFFADMPASFDHSAHYFQAWQFKENFFRRGPFFWSHLWFAGYPANYLYPFAVPLAITIVHCLTFGLFGFAFSYGLTFALGYFLHGYAVYYLGKRAFDRRIALFAAVLFLLERGGSFIGGWFWLAQVGTWPVAIGIAVGLMATARLCETFDRDDRRNVVVAGVLTGLSFLLHPLMMLYFPLLAGMLLLAMLTVPERRPALEILRDLAIAGGIGCAIGALWIFPLLAASEYGAPYGWQWGAIPELAARLYRGQIFNGSGTLTPLSPWFSKAALPQVPDDSDGLVTYVTVMGFLGLPFLLRARRPLAFLVAIFTVGGLVAASSSVHDFLGLRNFQSYRQIEFARFVMLVKPYLFLAAAASAMTMWRALAHAHPIERTRRGYVGLALAGFIAAIIYLPTFGLFLDRHLFQKTQFLSSDTTRPQHEKIAAWLNRRAEEDKRFFRLAALGDGKDDHSLLAMGALTKVPIFHLGFTPTINFKYGMNPKAYFTTSPSDSTAIFEALNVRYVLLKAQSTRTDLKYLESFGPFFLYEFTRWSPDPFKITEGEGNVTVKRFDPEDIELVAAPGSRGRLRLNVSHFSRWSATLDGKDIAITPTMVEENPGTGFMTVQLEPGTYHFRFRWKAAEWLGLLVFVAGIGGSAYLWRKA